MEELNLLKLLEEIIGEKLQLGKHFLDATPKAHQ